MNEHGKSLPLDGKIHMDFSRDLPNYSQVISLTRTQKSLPRNDMIKFQPGNLKSADERLNPDEFCQTLQPRNRKKLKAKDFIGGGNFSSDC